MIFDNKIRITQILSQENYKDIPEDTLADIIAIFKITSDLNHFDQLIFKNGIERYKNKILLSHQLDLALEILEKLKSENETLYLKVKNDMQIV